MCPVLNIILKTQMRDELESYLTRAQEAYLTTRLLIIKINMRC